MQVGVLRLHHSAILFEIMYQIQLLLIAGSLASCYTVTNVGHFMDKTIDPIMFPGIYNQSHMHSFFGSDAVTINTSTSSELQSGCSTATNPNDFSTYC